MSFIVDTDERMKWLLDGLECGAIIRRDKPIKEEHQKEPKTFFPINTNERLQWLIDGLENGGIVVGRTTEETEEEREQFRKELAEYRAARAAKCEPVPQVAYA